MEIPPLVGPAERVLNDVMRIVVVADISIGDPALVKNGGRVPRPRLTCLHLPFLNFACAHLVERSAVCPDFSWAQFRESPPSQSVRKASALRCVHGPARLSFNVANIAQSSSREALSARGGGFNGRPNLNLRLAAGDDHPRVPEEIICTRRRDVQFTGD